MEDHQEIPATQVKKKKISQGKSSFFKDKKHPLESRSTQRNLEARKEMSRQDPSTGILFFPLKRPTDSHTHPQKKTNAGGREKLKKKKRPEEDGEGGQPRLRRCRERGVA